MTLPSLPQLGISCLLQKDINGQWSEWVWPRRIHFWVLSFCVGGKTGQLKRKTDFPVKAFAISHVPESCAAFMVCWSCRRISCLFVTIGFYLHGCQHQRGKKGNISVLKTCKTQMFGTTTLNLLTKITLAVYLQLLIENQLAACPECIHANNKSHCQYHSKVWIMFNKITAAPMSTFK